MNLIESNVIFNEREHSYILDGKKLTGITGLIHSVLGLGVYPEAGDYVNDFAIPRAGSRGTAVHHAIQTYDVIGIKQTEQTVHTVYGSAERDNIEICDETWNVENELEAYIRHLDKGCFEPVANEYTVSDNVRYASQIDNVWRKKETKGIWLVDTKTNNVDLHPTCGYFIPNCFSNGVDALKEYLSWQLSIYAELFELQNPGIKVEGLACNWLRKDKSEFWIIERKSTDSVKELLNTDYVFADNKVMFMPKDITSLGIDTSKIVKKDNHLPIVKPDVVEYVHNLILQYEDVRKKLEEAKISLRKAMEEHKISKTDLGLFTASISKDSVVNSFDAKKFQKENPELYKMYIVETTRKGSLSLKTK